MLRACLYLLFFVPWTLLCALIAIVSTFIDSSGIAFHRLALFWSRLCLRIAGVRLRIEGIDLVPVDRPLIFMGNHQSYFDVPVMFRAIPIQFNWLAKEELFRIPLFGHSLRAAGYIPINRGNGREALKSLNQAATLIHSGKSVAIFPEGTFGENKLLPFKRGGFVLASHAKVPIVPFSISGAAAVNPGDRFLYLNPGPVIIRFSPPIEVDEQIALHPTLLMEQVRKAISSRME